MRNPIPLAKLAVAMFRLVRDLKRLDQVFEINDQLVAMRAPRDEANTLAAFASLPAGAEALRDRPRIGRVDLDRLRALPATSLGGAYVRFLDRNSITPAALPVLPGATDLDYVLAHFYETHDLWHVLTGFEADPAGELGVQAFLLAQFHAVLPFFVISAVLLNTALYAYADKAARLDAIARGWTLGRAATSLVGIDWASHFEAPLATVRRQFGLAS